MKKNILKNNIFQFTTKKILYGSNARKKLQQGIDSVCKTTQITLGPKGRNVAIEYELGLPKITKDGVTVAKNISFMDRTKEMGAALLRRVSHSTNLFAGDGTTTSTILANCLIKEGNIYVQNNKNPFEIKKGIEISKKKVFEFLEEIKKNITSQKDLYNVANVSSNYNNNIAEIVSEALWKIGINGIIEIEPGTKLENELFFTEGITINRGYISNEFLINKSRIKMEMNHPYILIANQEINQSKSILPILEKVKPLNRPLIIFCQDMSNEVMSNLLYNLHKGIIEVCPITVPGKGNFMKNILEDLSVITNSYFFDESDMKSLNDCTLEQLGRATKVTISHADTFIIGASGRSEQINERIDRIKFDLAHATTPTAIQILKDRLSRMTGKMAIVLCGGSSQIEMYENREKIVDALNSTKLAMSHGVLPGGGVSLIYASRILDFLELENEEQNLGKQIFQKALLKPTEILMKNAGLNGKYIIDQILNKHNDFNIGYDLNSNSYVNLTEKGIVDCFHVVKTAIEDAVSIGTLVLTTEVIVANEKNYTPAPLSTYRKEFF